MRSRTLAILVLLAIGATPGARAATTVPHLDHVLVIVEENTNYSDVFGAHASEAPYLNALADGHVRHDAYYGISHVSLGNYIGMVSGQVPGPLDHADCPTYGACVRPGPTIAKQLDDAGKTWRGYFGGMPAPCTHPGRTDIDPYQTGYATRHNPFVYFSEIVGDDAYCRSHVVPYETDFARDLSSGPRTLSLIVPDTCEDGHDAGCKGTKTQIQILDEWLAANVPPILNYINNTPNSALVVTFDEAAPSDTAGCCNQPPAIAGGGHVGFVIVAPGNENTGARVTTPANHYSLLRTLQDSFGLAPLQQTLLVNPMTELFA